jgi:prolyl oligopeptidase
MNQAILSLAVLAALGTAAACHSSKPTAAAPPAAQPAAAPTETASVPKFSPVKPLPVPAYPATRKAEQYDTYHGTKVEDPYRWLEDLNTPETEAWVAAQNKISFGYLEQIPFRDKLKERLTQLWNYPKFSAPFKKGGQYFYFKNDGLQNQSVLWHQYSIDPKLDQLATPRVFIDPNKFSADGTTSLSNLSFSHDNKLMAYSTSAGGSDWNEVYIADVEKKELLKDHLEWVKFSGMSWYKNGFYYSRYDAPKAGNKLANQNQFHKVYYHKLGDPQSADKLFFEDKTKPLRNFGASVTEDEKYLFLNLSEGASGANGLSFQDLTKPNSKITPLITDFKNSYSVIGNMDKRVYIRTNWNAPNYRVMLMDMSQPEPKNWKELIPERKEPLQSVSLVGTRLICTYMKDVASQVLNFTLDGKQAGEVQLPGPGAVSGFAADKMDHETFFVFTSYTYPPTVYRYDALTNQATLYKAPQAGINPDDYETRQEFYVSKDGTKVPMFITHRKGLKLDGNNPTLLYAYGGFNISVTPGFSPATMLWLENGGVYAVPNLRGGSEYGEAWHKAGMQLKKQTVFDDFIAAGEYLKKAGYTRTEKLAISGRSNGGLLVGAVMTQRPDLAKVALPGVGVMDMLRYHKFTIGWAWSPEYGSSDSTRHFKNLYGYSPLHNIKAGVKYPATMAYTADHDDRVVPAHSYKFISTLQEKGTKENPYLIRVDVKAGHGAGKPTSLQIQEWADLWSFTYQNMGVSPY